MGEVKRFSLKRKVEPVEIEDEAGRVFKYTIKEIMGGDRDDYVNFLISKVRLDAEGKPTKTYKDVKGVETELLVRCLYDEQGKLVTRETVDQFPSNMRTALFDCAEEVNTLTAAETKKVGEA